MSDQTQSTASETPDEEMIPKRVVISQLKSLINALEPHGFPPSNEAEELINHLCKLASIVEDHSGT